MKTKDIDSIRSRLLQWYQKNHRRLPWRQTRNPYRIWVSEVMLQQTQVKTVLPYYRKFLERFSDIKTLARAELQDVLKIWEGLGYYARARNFQRAAKVVIEKYHGVIPERWEDFRKLPGVGDYIASAVLSIAFHQLRAVVDGNVKRVLARLGKIDAPVNKSSASKKFKSLADRLIDPYDPGAFNQALMELGATVCKPANSECSICPLVSFCMTHRIGKEDEYPKRVKTRPTPEFHIVAGVVYKNDQVLITRRRPEGLLGGLWEFPGGKVGEGEDAERACAREIKEEVNLSVQIFSYLTRVKHAYTHFKIVMDVFCCKYVSGEVKLNGAVDYRWVTLDEIDRFPFPKANKEFIPLLQSMG